MGITTLQGYSCDRCKHEWIPRTYVDEIPIICPKCKSPYWNTPRQSDKQKNKIYSKKSKEKFR